MSVICKSWPGTLKKTWTWDVGKQCRPDQTPQNAASDQGLHFLLKLLEVKGKMKQSLILVQDQFSCLHLETIDPLALSAL